MLRVSRVLGRPGDDEMRIHPRAFSIPSASTSRWGRLRGVNRTDKRIVGSSLHPSATRLARAANMFTGSETVCVDAVGNPRDLSLGNAIPNKFFKDRVADGDDPGQLAKDLAPHVARARIRRQPALFARSELC